MKKLSLIVLIFLASTVGVARAPSKQEIRLLYRKSATNEKACKELIKLLKTYDLKDRPLFLGYEGSAVMMMANHVFNPFSKWSYFKRGKRMLQKAIKSDKKNIELRFLRFTIQKNLPSFLGYDDHIKTDKKFIISNISQLDNSDLKSYLILSLQSMNIGLKKEGNASKSIK